MRDEFDFIICSSIDEFGDSPTQFPGRHLKPKLSEISASEWNECLDRVSANFLAVADSSRPVSKEELSQAFESLRPDPDTDLILLFPPLQEGTISAWKKGPALLAALRENVAQRVWAVVGRTSAVKALGFVDVSDSMWDFVIRASADSGRIRAIPLSNEMSIDSPEPIELDRPGLVPNSPGLSRNWLKSHLEKFSLENMLPEVRSTSDAIALKAGLFQIHDYLDASHELSQSVEGGGRHRTGDYWHAIMHRREPDYSNSKYWFRRVGSHPIFEALGNAAEAIISKTESSAAGIARQKLSLGSHWDPFAFVDFCEECGRGGDPALTEIAQQIQWREMQLLLDQTCRDAAGS